MAHRHILVISGLAYSGKSTLLAQIAGQPGFEHTVQLGQDKILGDLYPGRTDMDITKTEHVFKNYWLRQQVLRELVLGAPMVMIESVMLTRTVHQRPFMEISREASVYVSSITEEARVRDSLASGNGLPKVELKVVLCYATPEVLLNRIARPDTDRRDSGTPIFSLAGMWGAYSQYEFPDDTTYEPLFLDTSDESSGGVMRRLEEVQAFVHGDLENNPLKSRRRWDAIASYRFMYEKVKEAAGV